MSLRKTAEKDQIRGASSADDRDAPMTADQLSRLKELSHRAGDPDSYSETLTKGEAQKRIAALEALLDREENSGIDRLPRT